MSYRKMGESVGMLQGTREPTKYSQGGQSVTVTAPLLAGLRIPKASGGEIHDGRQVKDNQRKDFAFPFHRARKTETTLRKASKDSQLDGPSSGSFSPSLSSLCFLFQFFHVQQRDLLLRSYCVLVLVRPPCIT